jgi:hypothetical protein
VNCNYQALVTVSLPLPHNASDFITVSPLNQVAQLTLAPTLRTQVRSYTITLSFDLLNYPTWFYPDFIQKTQSFVITILDPCTLTRIMPYVINSMETMASYSLKLQDEVSLPEFQDDLDYQDKMPVKGVYFFDSVSKSLRKFEFCGPKTFSFTGTYPLCAFFYGQNGDYLVFSAMSNCKPGVYNVTLNVTMYQNTSNSILSNFTAAVILVTPYTVANQKYRLSSAANTLSVGPFSI